VRAGAVERPEWWTWELELTPHIEKRMIQRSFTEIEMREMLSRAHTILPDREEGRYVVRGYMRSAPGK